MIGFIPHPHTAYGSQGSHQSSAEQIDLMSVSYPNNATDETLTTTTGALAITSTSDNTMSSADQLASQTSQMKLEGVTQASAVSTGNGGQLDITAHQSEVAPNQR